MLNQILVCEKLDLNQMNGECVVPINFYDNYSNFKWNLVTSHYFVILHLFALVENVDIREKITIIK